MIDGQSGEILDANCQVRWDKTPYVLPGHGARHQVAVCLAANLSCVAITRLQEGYVTLFSSEYLPPPRISKVVGETPTCFRIVGQVERRGEIISKIKKLGGHKDLGRRAVGSTPILLPLILHLILSNQQGLGREFALSKL